MGLRIKFAELIGGKQLQEENNKARRAVSTLYDAYLDGPWEVSPDVLIAKLKEYDSAALVDLVNDLQYETIGGLGSEYRNDGGRRQRAIQESNRMWMNSPLASWVVTVWTSYGMGERVYIKPDDENAIPYWQDTIEFSDIFSDERLHELSDGVLVDGNVFLVQFISELDGSSTWDTIDTGQIVEIVKDPNTNKPMFYKRQFTNSKNAMIEWYYPDANAYYQADGNIDTSILPRGAKVTTDISTNNTIALILHIAHNRKDRSGWGWPIFTTSAPYMRAHKNFLENRLAVSRSKASYARELTTSGGSRGVAAVKAKLNSTLSSNNALEGNPQAVAGSELIHNEAVKLNDLKMQTGASDAETDNKIFSWVALIGSGLFPTSAGLDTSRWATAVAMDKTQSVQWTRYKGFWAANLRRVVKLTLLAVEKFGNLEFSTLDATISIDTLSLTDFPGVVEPVSKMLNSLLPYIENETVPTEAAKMILQSTWGLMLQALGVNNADEIVSDDMFGVSTTEGDVKKMIEIRKLFNELKK